MGFEDKLLKVSPPVSLPKGKARVLGTGGGGGCAPAKPYPGEETFKKVKSKCPGGGGVRAASNGCDPAVDDGCVESGSPPAKGPVPPSSSDCACVVRLRSLPQLDEAALEGNASVVGGDDDGASLAPSGPGSSTPSDQTTEEMVDDCLSAGYETPTESVFNPFAPGPEQLGELAPLILAKPSRVRRVPLRRQLQFDSCDSPSSSRGDDDDNDDDDDDTAKGTGGPAPTVDGCGPSDDQMDEEDKRLLGSLYATNYNFILSTLLEEQSSPVRQSSLSDEEDDSPRTPPAVPFLTGIADTCPGAPVRHVSKARKLDPAICKKLDFS